MKIKRSIVCFGEGKCEGIFLQHIKSLYGEACPSTRVKVVHGRGGSPKHLANQLIKKHLSMGNYDGALLLLDEDVKDDIPKAWLTKNSITVSRSMPHCIEGLFLTLLEDPPPSKERSKSSAWKSRFQKVYLKTDSSRISERFLTECPRLFPRDLIDRKRVENRVLLEITAFLGV